MSYALKYQSDFYNFHKKLVSVKLYKKDYGSFAPIMVRTSEVSLEVNYEDDNTPVIGTGVKVGIINEGAFDAYEDLLSSTEKQFKCVIEYDGVVVFQGFSICDLNEQQFLQYSRISLQFTDYMKRLESDFLDCLSDMGVNTSLYAILSEALVKTGLIQHPAEASSDGSPYYPLYVNSTLFESTMAATVGDTFIHQVFFENNMFYTDPTSYDDTYTVLNKVLKSFNAHLYSYGNCFVLERIDDVTRTGDWIIYDEIDSSLASRYAIASLKKEYNKQLGDFKYRDTSQILAYLSGLKTLVVDLKTKQLETVVFNNYKKDMLTTANLYPVAGSLDLRNWYMYNTGTAVKNGFAFRDISQYFQWTTPVTGNENCGLYYPFEVTFNATSTIPTVLSISFKMACDTDLTNVKEVRLRICLMIDGGTKSGYYVYFDDSVLHVDDDPRTIDAIFDVSEDKRTKMWSFSISIDCTNTPLHDFVLGGTWDDLFTMLGRPVKQKFVLCFWPIRYVSNGNNIVIETNNYIGDVQVNITQQEILNKLTYFINENFIKTDTEDIDFFDLANTNFGNGLIGVDGVTKTTETWTTAQYTTPQSLMDIYARVKFGNYCRTIHKLKSTILFDGYLKPFSVLTDDNLMINSDHNLKMLVLGYTWDLFNGSYDIDTVEYTEEEILIDNSGSQSGGEEDPGQGTGAVPTYPAGWYIEASQPSDSIVVDWVAMDNLIGDVVYTLQRRPFLYNSVEWVDGWLTIYTGTALTYDDHVQDIGLPLDDGTAIYYRLMGTNANGDSDVCYPITWNLILS